LATIIRPIDRLGQFQYCYHAFWEKTGIKCEFNETLYWPKYGFGLAREWDSLFAAEASRVGVSVAGAEASVFGGNTRNAAYEIGAVIEEVRANIEFTISAGSSVVKNADRIRGLVSIAVKWEVYSRLQRRVVLTLPVLASAHTKDWLPIVEADRAFHAAFASAVRHLLANAEFRALLERGVDAPVAKRGHDDTTPLTLTSSAAGGKSMAQAQASVVTVLVGDGHGSGFVVADGDYVITDHHVVDYADRVILRRPDGREVIGKVLRSKPKRDVALIHAPGLDLKPLAIERKTPAIGSNVYAIGAPLEEALAGTVVSGIVSSIREMNNLDYIQSDARAHPGMSGGPLLNQNGAVIGITVLARVDDQGGESGMNFFSPIGDALDSMSVDIQRRAMTKASASP
jgi:S1-C subfamily serine protease